MRQQDPKFNDTMKCLLLQQMILRKMLAEQADRDSVIVSDDDVEGQLENRLRYFTQLYGSKEKLELISGKTIYQIKEENRDAIREQMVAEKLQEHGAGKHKGIAGRGISILSENTGRQPSVFSGHCRSGADSGRPTGEPGDE